MGLKEVLQTSRRYLLAILAFSVLLASILIHSVLGISLSPILSGSMKPLFNVGDLLITQDVPAHQLKVGDVVVLRNGQDYTLFAHRIIRISEINGTVFIQTKGDANPTEDQGTLRVAAFQTMPRGFGRLPWAGSLLDTISRNRIALFADFGLLALASLGLNRFFYFLGHRRKSNSKIVAAPAAETTMREKVKV